MNLRLLTSQDLRRALPMARAIEASRQAFLALARGEVQAPPRTHLVQGAGTTLLMGAGGPVGRVAKVVSIFPTNAGRGLATTSGLLTLIDAETGQALGICDGGTLTAIRTGAVAGLATDLLGRRDARIGAVLGAGAQAETQLLAMAEVRDLQEIRVFARRPEALQAFVARLQAQVQAEVRAVASPQQAVEGADVVSAATSSSEPVLCGDDLAPGTHLNGVGSFRLDMRELDERSIARAARIVVDLRAAALHEAGELVAACAAGVTRSEDWLELGELCRDPSRGRSDAAQITLFKSVGHAAQDLFAARAAFAQAEALGIGQRLEL